MTDLSDLSFRCADCGNRFRNSRALLDHLVREHPERVERCKDGDATGARSGRYQRGSR